MGLAELNSLVTALEHYDGALAGELEPHPYDFAGDVLVSVAELLGHQASIMGKAWLKSYTPPKLRIVRPWEPEDVRPAKMTSREDFARFIGAGRVRYSAPRTTEEV